MSDLFTFETDGERSDSPRRRDRRRRPSRRFRLGPLVALVVVVALGLAAVLGGRALWRAAGSPPDYAGAGTGVVYVQVKDGDTAADIGDTLVATGVVKSSRAFRKAAKSDSRSRSIQPGTYRLHHRMSGAAALATILDPNSLIGRITIPEGLTASQTITLLAQKAKVSRTQLSQAATEPNKLGLPSSAHGHVEGYLYPSTYDVAPDASATAVLKAMVKRFTQRHDEDSLTPQIPGQPHLTPEQVVIVASLLEKEGITSDFPRIARVIYNRLAIDKPLQLDSTINYALHRNQVRVSQKLTHISSPYNTYRHTGLPPTPIANPGDAALTAALHPATGDWLFFVKADRAGHSFFTADPKAFAAQKAKSQREGVY